MNTPGCAIVPPAGSGALANNVAIPGTVKLEGAKYISGIFGPATVGTTDVYQVPAGRKAYIFPNGRIYNGGVSNATTYFSAKIGGQYYRISSFGTVAAGAAAALTVSGGFILNSGESLAVVETLVAGANVECQIVEFDASVPFKRAEIFSVTAGNNVVYQCPAGKTAFFGGPFRVDSAPSVQILNTNASTCNPYYNVVPSGGSAGPGNRITTTLSVTTTMSISTNLFTNLASQDFISINTDISGSLYVYTTVYEV